MLQPTRIRDAVANCSCNARGTGFLENHPVATALDHPAAKSRRDNGQAVRLRFELRNRESIRERRKNEYVGGSVRFSSLLLRHMPKPFHSRLIRHRPRV